MARLAQSVERKAFNLVVVGSSRTVGVCSPVASCDVSMPFRVLIDRVGALIDRLGPSQKILY